MAAFVPAIRTLAHAPLSQAAERDHVLQQKPLLRSNVSLGDDDVTITAKLGQPLLVQPIQGAGTPEWHYPDMIIRFWYDPTGKLGVKQILLTTPSAGSMSEGIQIGSPIATLKRAYRTALKDYHAGGFGVPLSPGKSLGFLQANESVTLIILEDNTCSNCAIAIGPQGPRKEP